MFHAQTATGKLNAEIIGFQNTKCEYCYEIKSSEKFRFNRLRCRDCERDEPIGKFKRCVRSRIYIALKKNKRNGLSNTWVVRIMSILIG